MFDAIRSLMQDLTSSGRCAVNDKILTSSEDLNIEVVKNGLGSEGRKISCGSCVVKCSPADGQSCV